MSVGSGGGGEGRGSALPWNFIYDTDILDRGLVLLFLVFFRRPPPPWKGLIVLFFGLLSVAPLPENFLLTPLATPGQNSLATNQGSFPPGVD